MVQFNISISVLRYEEPHICCNIEFWSFFEKKRHRRDAHPDGTYACSICEGRKFCDFNEYNRHMRVHFKIKPFQCDYCEHK